MRIGLGAATKIDRLEVRWLTGLSETWTDWLRIAFGTSMKGDRDMAKAAALFRDALAIDPAHEDARYYLANYLAVNGDLPGATVELNTLAQMNPQSRRTFQRKGELIASRAELAAARPALVEASRLNSEQSGAWVLLGEVDLALGELASAE